MSKRSNYHIYMNITCLFLTPSVSECILPYIGHQGTNIAKIIFLPAPHDIYSDSHHQSCAARRRQLFNDNRAAQCGAHGQRRA